MNLRFVEWLKGYVVCTITSKHTELFINMAMKKNIHFWDFGMISNNTAKFTVTVEDFFKLKDILRRSYSKIHVTKRIGLPFIVNKSYKRKGLAIGFVLFILTIYMFSSMILSISITGNKKVNEEIIYKTVKELGIHEGMLKFSLPEQKDIQQYLISKIDDLAWVGVKMDGTNLKITVVEKVKPDGESVVMPRNLVSAKDAVIYRILSEKGSSQVKKNDRVKKGDILISGIIGNEENYQAVTAKGEVLGVVWYESNAVIPLTQHWNEYTGNVIVRNYIGVGNRMVKYKGYNEVPFDNYQKKYNVKRLSWGKYQMPIVLVQEKLLEYQERERILTEKDAVTIALKQTKEDLYSKIKSNSKIISEKVLHRNIDNGKLSLKVLYEVIEDITVPKPIIQGD